MLTHGLTAPPSETCEINRFGELCGVEVEHLSARVRLAPNVAGTVAVQKAMVRDTGNPASRFEEVHAMRGRKLTTTHVQESSANRQTDLAEICELGVMGVMDLNFKPVRGVLFALIHVQVVPEPCKIPNGGCWRRGSSYRF